MTQRVLPGLALQLPFQAKHAVAHGTQRQAERQPLRRYGLAATFNLLAQGYQRLGAGDACAAFYPVRQLADGSGVITQPDRKSVV